MIEQLQTALDWHGAGRAVALATVVETWGSAPRPAGSQLVIDEHGEFEGSVSGGCVEGAVVAEALEAIAAGKPALLSYGVADETAWEVGLACGGKIKGLVEPVGAVRDPALMARVVEQVAARRPVIVATRLADGVSRILGARERDGDLAAAAAELARTDRSGIVQTKEGAVFVCVYNPDLRMAIIGAVHIAQSLVPLARQLGFAVTVIDPRGAFASPARFPDAANDPDVALVPKWPDEVLVEHPLDARTALVALTHDPKIDDPGLERLNKGLDGLKQRTKTLLELAESALIYCRHAPMPISPAAAKLLDPDATAHLKQLSIPLRVLAPWDEPNLESLLREYCEQSDIKFGKIAQPLRAALTGTTKSPGIFEVMNILGRDEVLRRLSTVTGETEPGFFPGR